MNAGSFAEYRGVAAGTDELKDLVAGNEQENFPRRRGRQS